MKQEIEPYTKNWKTFEDVLFRISDWIDDYNHERYQKDLGERTPNAFYAFSVSKYQTAFDLNVGKIPAVSLT